MKRLIVAALIAVLVAAGTTSLAVAHPTGEFSACAAGRRSGGLCRGAGGTYLYGQVVRLRAQVRPPHSPFRAVVMRRRPYSQNWERFDTVFISDTGRIRWSWQTGREDAVQRRPYGFRFRIPHHGVSNSLDIWVIFGE